MQAVENVYRAFHVMAKPAGASCNLDCRYCFYTPKSQLYPTGRPRMDDGLLESYIRQMLESQPGPEVLFAWQGGEPLLMGLPFFRRAVGLQQALCPPGMVVRNVIQTNGTLLDAEWGRFLREHDFLLGVSLDGPEELHDAYRTDRSGRGSFASVVRGIRVLQEHGIPFNILCTVHAANGDYAPEVYHFLRDEIGSEWIQFIPIVERTPDGGVTNRSVRPEQFGCFLCAAFDEWLCQDVGKIFVQEYEVTLGVWLGQPSGLCVHAPVCGLNVALEHNGDVYACDHFVDPAHLLGNIRDTPLTDLVFSQQQRQFGQTKRTSLPASCRQCDVLFACQGGCPKDRFASDLDRETGLNYLCAGYQLFFRHIGPSMERMAELVRRGRPPSCIMAEKAREDAGIPLYTRVGRNDPCPCGSGRKFKRCHGID